MAAASRASADKLAEKNDSPWGRAWPAEAGSLTDKEADVISLKHIASINWPAL
jgi:hypothetical protein